MDVRFAYRLKMFMNILLGENSLHKLFTRVIMQRCIFFKKKKGVY